LAITDCLRSSSFIRIFNCGHCGYLGSESRVGVNLGGKVTQGEIFFSFLSQRVNSISQIWLQTDGKINMYPSKKGITTLTTLMGWVLSTFGDLNFCRNGSVLAPISSATAALEECNIKITFHTHVTCLAGEVTSFFFSSKLIQYGQ
jgi:hypothetical protein